MATGGTALDPEVIQQLFVRSRRVDPLAGLTPRETDTSTSLGWGALTLASLLARATEHRIATYHGVRALDVDLAFESVEIVGSADATSVSMTRSYTWSLAKPSISNRLDRDLLSIASSCPFSVDSAARVTSASSCPGISKCRCTTATVR